MKVGSRAQAEIWLAVGLITLAAIAAYAPSLARFGFYRDDWYQIWAGDTLGPRSIITMFSIDRPVMGYTYAAAFFILRDSPMAWQIYALFLRWLGSLGSLWMFRRLWPGQAWATTSAAVLFLVYPGFLQQPNGNTFSNHLFGYAAGVLSIAATVEALQSPSRGRRVGLTAFAVAAGLTCWLIYEYMIGLEALRYVLIARRIRRPGQGIHWRGFAADALPYAIPLAGYLAWRLLLFHPGRGTVDVAQVVAAYGPSPGLALLERAVTLAQDFVETILVGWVAGVRLLPEVPAGQLALGLIPVAVAVAAYVVYARGRGQAARPPEVSGSSSRDMVLLGAFTTLASLAPVVLAGRDVRWDSAFDRYTLHATLGLGMLTSGLVFQLTRQTLRVAAVGLLLGGSVFLHQANAWHWARFWEEQRQMWWQMSWRIPDLEDGTVLLVTLPSQRFFEDYEVWGPANLVYAAGDPNPPIAAQVVEAETIRFVQQQHRDVRSMRVVIGIPRDYAHALIADWPSGDSCVHFIEGVQPEFPQASAELLRSIGELSRSDRIVADSAPAVPPGGIFGAEPERGWCWHYQAGALARQRGDWPAGAALADRAQSLGFQPRDPSEWMPFFQAYLNLGRTADAARLAEAIRQHSQLREALCLSLSDEYFLDEQTYNLGRDMLCGGVALAAWGRAPTR